MAAIPRGQGPIRPREVHTLARGVVAHLWRARSNPELHRRAVRRWVTAAREIARDAACSGTTGQPAASPGVEPEVGLAWREMTEPAWQGWVVIDAVARTQGAVVARSAVLYVDGYYWPALNGDQSQYVGAEAETAAMMQAQLLRLVTNLDYTLGWSSLQRQCHAELGPWVEELISYGVAHQVAPILDPEQVEDPQVIQVQLVWSADAA